MPPATSTPRLLEPLPCLKKSWGLGQSPRRLNMPDAVMGRQKYDETETKTRPQRGNPSKNLRQQFGNLIRYQFGAQHLSRVRNAALAPGGYWRSGLAGRRSSQARWITGRWPWGERNVPAPCSGCQRESSSAPSRPCNSRSQEATQAQNLTRPKSPSAMARPNTPQIQPQKKFKITLDSL